MLFKNNLSHIIFYKALTLTSLVLFFTLSLSPFVYFAPIIITIYALIYSRNNENVEQQLKLISFFTLGYFYTVVFPFFAIKVLSIENDSTNMTLGLKLFISMLLLTFINDIFAYIFGRLFGNVKILPHISPKKTISGSIGGLAATALASVFVFHYYLEFTNIISAAAIGLICGIAGQCGDFFASLLKRVSNVKDSGKIIPGHGGVIDRLDGLYFVAPIFYGLYYLFLI